MLKLKEKINTNENSKYLKNIFIWCGYNIKYLKNIIYTLDFYIKYPLFENQEFLNNLTTKTILTILNSYKQSFLFENEISCGNIKDIIKDILTKHFDNYIGFDKPEAFKQKQEKMFLFLKNSIDICCKNYKKNMIVTNSNLILFPTNL
jgi:hypothetical protein